MLTNEIQTYIHQDGPSSVPVVYVMLDRPQGTIMYEYLITQDRSEYLISAQHPTLDPQSAEYSDALTSGRKAYREHVIGPWGEGTR